MLDMFDNLNIYEQKICYWREQHASFVVRRAKCVSQCLHTDAEKTAFKFLRKQKHK